MIQSLLILLIGIGIGMAAAGRLTRRRTGEREVRMQVHELELMTAALVKARAVLVEIWMRVPFPHSKAATPESNLERAMVMEALDAVKLALGESNGHAVKHDKPRRGVWA